MIRLVIQMMIICEVVLIMLRFLGRLLTAIQREIAVILAVTAYETGAKRLNRPLVIGKPY